MTVIKESTNKKFVNKKLANKKLENKKQFICFVFIEFVLYISFLYLDIFTNNSSSVSSYLKFTGVLGCLFFTVFLLGNTSNLLYRNLFRVALFFTVVSDVFLLLTDESDKGVFTFLIVQGIYRYYLWEYKNKEQGNQTNLKLRYLYVPNILIGIIVLILLSIFTGNMNLLLGVTAFYFVSIVLNVIVAIREAFLYKKTNIVLFAIGMVLFLLCDINVGIFNMSGFIQVNGSLYRVIYHFSTVGMWLFYLPAQVLIATSLLFSKKG